MNGAALVRKMLDTLNDEGVEAALAWVAEDFHGVVPPELSAEPDTYHGHEGARRYFAGFDGMLEDVRYEAIELIPAGERVIAHIRLGGRGVSSGLDVELEAFVVHELAGGKVTRMRPYPDMDSARAAAGA
jgi:ketosteroid isomerase-like protein